MRRGRGPLAALLGRPELGLADADMPGRADIIMAAMTAPAIMTISNDLALGLPVGGDLEYADRLTIERSLQGRTRLSTSL